MVCLQQEQHPQAQIHQQAREREMCHDQYDQAQQTAVVVSRAKQMQSAITNNC